MDVALVLAGRDETFHYSPLKLAEYLAAGRAVVAPDVPQIADRVEQGEEAILVPPSDSTALATALRRLHDDPALRARLGANARAAGSHSVVVGPLSGPREVVARLEFAGRVLALNQPGDTRGRESCALRGEVRGRHRSRDRRSSSQSL